MSIINKILSRPGTGWREDKPDDRDLVWQFGATTSRDKVDLSVFCPKVWDQKGYNDCVLQAVIAAMMTISARNGKPLPLLSRRFGYWNSRRAHRMQYIDRGTSIRVCAEQIRKVGICLEEHWTYDKPVNRKPSWFAYTQAADFWNHKYYKIRETFEDRIDALKTSLVKGNPVIFGTQAPARWANNGAGYSDASPANHDRFLGGHAMLIVGYETTELGYTWFKVRNSWGERWANNGYILLGQDWITWPLSRDFTVVEGRV